MRHTAGMLTIAPDVMDSCIRLVKQVGRFQMKHFRSMPEGADDMKAVRETVSFVDVESEKILMDGLLPMVDGAGFFGEESGKSGSQDLVWVVDPLDGTTNFLSGIDQFCVSVALVENGEPILGLVYKPISGEVFSCVHGHGVFYNGSRTRAVHPSITASDALFVTGFPYRSPDVTTQFFKAAEDVLMLGRGIRRSGSAALDVANLSMGWFQGFWETDLQPYDVAAGILMMRENGLLVTNQNGEPYDLFADRLLVAAMPEVHPAFLEVIARSYSIEE
ncbi:MAG: inositol monophosphatase [Verrucomicrobiae bacterium]|nr:inositol monophosphatase [Verrucomicrobiae bacterium]NNJ42995.1 inositol monophosphatase [Akkermansiaceae bacterium]